ncbi:MAG TPA: hypothetical protein DDZ96_05685 [Porphyromonadaceae bacterium]|jgi:CTP:phosphocholine cytidylyltransferase-like protein|nr:hypothetical protein [Porphyromonadaceae bacterium]HBX19417.1 hypothetical protein [Porphyromonadaceae bacterium]HBX45252.1 hypothetical protein [Porphyromonadaceae bacterium]HCM22543.1 hypothetical protein [Porphyromonadaceae bacterium]
MVYIHEQVYADLDLVFNGMLHWNKAKLSFAFVEQYIDDIITHCYAIDRENYHFAAKYSEHKRYGAYIYRYRRNKQTIWYIIYDMDIYGNIFVNKIISNYTTL